MKKQFTRLAAFLLSLMLLCSGAMAETASLPQAPSFDPSPAIYVAQATASSVVGVITLEQYWIRAYDRIQETTVAMGSGVVIREGGYVLTNQHVIADGSTYRILLPSGEKADAVLVGADESTDLAVLQIQDEAAAAQLTPVTAGSSEAMVVGSTVVAIGNPGGEDLANTVTQGVISALERDNVSSGRKSRSISYIQHDAAINSGNSGGGLFNYKGELIGINTLKYAGSSYSGITFEGLGFAIPVELAAEISADLIEFGKVRRASMGAKYSAYSEGPEEPMRNAAPSGVYITGIPEGSPAEAAGFKLYDCVYSINGVRTHNYAEMTTELDQFEAGEVIEVEVVRYEQIAPTAMNTAASLYDYYFGSGNAGASLSVSGGYETIKLSVTLEYEE